jgi:hypothetical protein
MSTRSTRGYAGIAISALASIALAACAVIGSESAFDGPPTSPGCQTTLGSYVLPKTVLNFVITKTPDDPSYVLQPINATPIPDNEHTFCLDHLRSPLASDEVVVFKNKIVSQEDPSDGSTAIKIAGSVVLRNKRKITSVTQTSTPFLQLVASKAVDHTAGIIRRIIRAAFILISNKGDFNPGRSAVGVGQSGAIPVADFTVDPFDDQEMARVNGIVRKFGFCFVLEDYTFDRSAGSGVNAVQYCRAPEATDARKPPQVAAALKELHYLVPKPVSGIFYRPRASYQLSIYINDDPLGHGHWRLGRMANFTFENIMPIVSVGVDRAIFATRRAGLVFSDGALTNVCISKGSEAQSAVQIPLDVIYGLISLPSETIIATVNDSQTATSLLQARQNLIAAQNSYIKFLNNSTATQFPSVSVPGTTKGPLTLGSTASAPDTVTFAGQESPDAGPIYASDGDPLSEICAELAVTSTMNPSPTSTPNPGSF